MSIATSEKGAKWPPPNFDNPEFNSTVVLGFTAPMLGLVLTFVCIRFYGKGVVKRALGLNDWMMLVAAVSISGPYLYLYLFYPSCFQFPYQFLLWFL